MQMLTVERDDTEMAMLSLFLYQAIHLPQSRGGAKSSLCAKSRPPWQAIIDINI